MVTKKGLYILNCASHVCYRQQTKLNCVA